MRKVIYMSEQSKGNEEWRQKPLQDLTPDELKLNRREWAARYLPDMPEAKIDACQKLTLWMKRLFKINYAK